ncbi:MAG: fibrobacter succinogenes major paralogous domain-containing protein [Bacteroidales bacterium]|jgi:uncharacterized protein (TIGR02145 family)|nr:fibrobacter succinogenes major paralogous domain-containing protein [Bacteroidales bacterium]
MKETKAITIPLIVLTTVFIFHSCKQDKPITPDNPLNGRTTAIFNPDLEYGTMNDIEGNIYKTIQIGDQIWMSENLRTTKYRNSDPIITTFENDLWANAVEGLFCNYNNTEDLDTIATYGRLYNWYAVNDIRNISPEGWRVPTTNDWLTLINFLGGDSIASNKLKEVGNLHWGDPFESNNSSGFTAIPNGFRYLSNEFFGLGYYNSFWTSSEYSDSKAGFLYIYYFSSKVSKGINYKANGYSIRCIKE